MHLTFCVNICKLPPIRAVLAGMEVFPTPPLTPQVCGPLLLWREKWDFFVVFICIVMNYVKYIHVFKSCVFLWTLSFVHILFGLLFFELICRSSWYMRCKYLFQFIICYWILKISVAMKFFKILYCTLIHKVLNNFFGFCVLKCHP